MKIGLSERYKKPKTVARCSHLPNHLAEIRTHFFRGVGCSKIIYEVFGDILGIMCVIGLRSSRRKAIRSHSIQAMYINNVSSNGRTGVTHEGHILKV